MLMQNIRIFSSLIYMASSCRQGYSNIRPSIVYSNKVISANFTVLFSGITVICGLVLKFLKRFVVCGLVYLNGFPGRPRLPMAIHPHAFSPDVLWFIITCRQIKATTRGAHCAAVNGERARYMPFVPHLVSVSLIDILVPRQSDRSARTE